MEEGGGEVNMRITKAEKRPAAAVTCFLNLIDRSDWLNTVEVKQVVQNVTYAQILLAHASSCSVLGYCALT